MESCQNAIYSEMYEDFIVEVTGRTEEIANNYQTDCFQMVNNQFAIFYGETLHLEEKLKNDILIVPRCFGLLSSEEMLSETGVDDVQRIPGLSLFGQGVLFGIIDTGNAVRKRYFLIN